MKVDGLRRRTKRGSRTEASAEENVLELDLLAKMLLE